MPAMSRSITQTAMGLAIAAAVGSSYAQAPQVAGVPSASIAAPTASGENPSAISADSPKHTPFITAPSIKPHLLDVKGLQAAGYSASTENNKNDNDIERNLSASNAENTSYSTRDTDDKKDLESLTYLLAPNFIPLPLRYSESSFNYSIALDVPTVAEVKLMLPGPALDKAESARYEVSKYIGNLTGDAAQRRELQKLNVDEWVKSTDKIAQQLSTNPWQIYQFRRLIQATLKDYKLAIATQSKVEINKVAMAIRPEIQEIGLVVNEFPTYEAKKAWYNILTQMNDNFKMYQEQITSQDADLLMKIDSLLSKYPEVPRPAGNPPKSAREQSVQTNQLTAATKASVGAELDAVKKPAAPLQNEDDSASAIGGIFILFGALGLGGFYFSRLRKKPKEIA